MRVCLLKYSVRYFYQIDHITNLKCQCCNERAFSRSTFDCQMFLFCFTRAKEFEPSRRAENSIPGFYAGRCFDCHWPDSTGCGAIKLNASD